MVAILGGLGVLSYFKLLKWVRRLIAEKVEEGLAETIKNAAKELADSFNSGDPPAA